MGSLYITLGLILIIFIFGYFFHNSADNSKHIPLLFVFVILFTCIIIQSGLFFAIFLAWKEYPYTLIDLLSLSHLPLWFVFITSIYSIINQQRLYIFVPSIIGTFISLAILNEFNLALTAFFSIEPIKDYFQILLINIAFHFSLLIGIGSTICLTSTKSNIPWSFIFIFVFVFLTICNLQNYDILTINIPLIAFNKTVYLFSIFFLLYISSNTNKWLLKSIINLIIIFFPIIINNIRTLSIFY